MPVKPHVSDDSVETDFEVVETKTETVVEEPSVVVVERPILCIFTRWFSQKN